jgi:hypothetical protein
MRSWYAPHFEHSPAQRMRMQARMAERFRQALAKGKPFAGASLFGRGEAPDDRRLKRSTVEGTGGTTLERREAPLIEYFSSFECRFSRLDQVAREGSEMLKQNRIGVLSQALPTPLVPYSLPLCTADQS